MMCVLRPEQLRWSQAALKAQRGAKMCLEEDAQHGMVHEAK